MSTTVRRLRAREERKRLRFHPQSQDAQKRERLLHNCRRKLRHASYTAALDVLHSTATVEESIGMVVYECQFCRGWHIGHRRRSRAA